MMLVYTSITKNYLPKARVLAKSLKFFHPDWLFVVIISDNLPAEFSLQQEPFDDILTVEQLGIADLKSWMFGHALVELCTAVKGPAAEILAKRTGVDKIMYIDPDIKIFNSLSELELLLDKNDILLTPHLLDMESDISAIKDNEISALKHGVYNLGFFAAKTSGQGLEFIHWWSDRLRLFCRDDISGGLFTDQRWCDLAPAFFNRLHIIRDRGYNVATWNIAHRPLSQDSNGEIYVAGVKLRFYHFTSYDNGNGLLMLKKYGQNQKIAEQLWNDYGADIVSEGHGDQKYKAWNYEQFDNGQSISLQARRFYRDRKDIQERFSDPYSIIEPSYYSHWNYKSKPIFGLFFEAVRVLKNEGFFILISKFKNYMISHFYKQ